MSKAYHVQAAVPLQNGFLNKQKLSARGSPNDGKVIADDRCLPLFNEL
jgi:hypothetical protein